MKRIITIIAAIVFAANVFAQAPNKMSYQAVVRDGSGFIVSNHAVGVKISVLQGSNSGSAVFVETHTPTSNDNGLISLEIGCGTLVSGSFSGIDWSAGPYYIKSETDPAGGTSYSIVVNKQLETVPYAFYAKKAANGMPDGSATGNTLHWNGSAWVAENETDPKVGSLTTDYYPKWNGTNLVDGVISELFVQDNWYGDHTLVGIGTATPNATLHVKGIQPEAAIRLEANGGAPLSMSFIQQQGNNEWSRIQTTVYSGGNTDMYFKLRSAGGNGVYSRMTFDQHENTEFYTNNTERMRIASDGNIGIGTSSPGAVLDVNGDALINGVRVGKGNGGSVWSTALGFGALNNANAGTEGNTAVGTRALISNTSGQINTAVGTNALYANQTGVANTAIGYGALYWTTSSVNTAVGTEAMEQNSTGSENAVFGTSAMQYNTSGSYNTILGSRAAQGGTSGTANTAIGYQTLYGNHSGSGNIVIGFQAGMDITGDNNIAIANGGVANENNTIRIGGNQTNAYMAGIYGTTVSNSYPVVIDADGHLGTGTAAESDWSTSGDDIYNNNSGNVGIGTTPNSNYKLTTLGNALFSLPQFENVDIYSYGGGLRVTNDYELMNATLRANTGGSAYAAQLDLNTPGGSISLESPGQYGDDISILRTSGDLQLINGSTTNMAITSTGNVGIGTTDPDTKLHVIGSIKMVDGNEGAGKVLTSDANGVGSWKATSELFKPVTNNVPSFFIDNSMNNHLIYEDHSMDISEELTSGFTCDFIYNSNYPGTITTINENYILFEKNSNTPAYQVSIPAGAHIHIQAYDASHVFITIY